LPPGGIGPVRRIRPVMGFLSLPAGLIRVRQCDLHTVGEGIGAAALGRGHLFGNVPRDLGPLVSLFGEIGTCLGCTAVRLSHVCPCALGHGQPLRRLRALA
jgi:hypothetical protein